MNVETLLTGLAGLTFVAVLVFAVTSGKEVQQRMQSDRPRKSSLAADGNRNRKA